MYQDVPGYTECTIISLTSHAHQFIVQVSYGAKTTNRKTERISTFYRTLPSDLATSVARLVLLVNHKWFRIAILKSNEEQYSQVSMHDNCIHWSPPSAASLTSDAQCNVTP